MSKNGNKLLVFEFLKTSLLLELITKAHFHLSNRNYDKRTRSIYRRIYRLAVLKIVFIEFIQITELQHLLPHFGVIKFPFSGIDAAEDPVDPLLLQKARGIVQRRIGKPFPVDEFELRKRAYEKLMALLFLFVSDTLPKTYEFHSKLMDKKYTSIIDDVVYMRAPEEFEFLEDYPQIMKEYALEPLLPCWSQDNELKLVNEMRKQNQNFFYIRRILE